MKTKNLLIINLYRQSNDKPGSHRLTNVEFRNALGIIIAILTSIKSPAPDIILTGDFNLPHAIWPNGDMRTGATSDEQAMIEDLKDLASEWFITQMVLEPTHRCRNTLDLLFKNDPDIMHSYTCKEAIFSTIL